MSLKARVRTAIVLLVTGVVFVLSALNLHNTAEGVFNGAEERADTAARQVTRVVLHRVQERTADLDRPPADIEESKRVWADILRQDRLIPTLLNESIANTRSIVEITIYDSEDRALTSSNTSRIGAARLPLPDFIQWNRQSSLAKLWDVYRNYRDYRLEVPLGAGGATMFTVSVVISPVLLKDAIAPQVRNVIGLSLLSLGLSGMLAVAFSHVMLRPLARISAAIDRISSGAETAPEPKEAQEVREVQSKLSILGQKVAGAREDAVQLRSNVQQLFERLEQAVLLFDGSGRLTMAGKPAERFLAASAEELTGRKLEDVFPATTDLGAAVQSAVELAEPLSNRVIDGVQIDVEPLPRRSGTLVVLRDAESREKIVSQLDLATRLEGINRLTSGVAHEIKNPLNAMTLHLEVLKVKLANEGLDIAEVEVIGREIERLDRVVKTFLNFTRPVRLNIAPIDLQAMLAEISTLVEPGAARKGIRVRVSVPEKATVMADPDLLKQALLNIVVNGIEAMSEPGELDMKAERAAADWKLTFRDQGPGIPAAIREKIFNLYFSTKDSGSGIGLAMTAQVVQLHGGAIAVDSEPGKGATFTVRLPAARKPAESGATAKGQA
jgi:signal transduction histidine kinase